MNRRLITTFVATTALGLSTVGAGVVGVVASVPAAGATPQISQVWATGALPDAGNPIALSSPTEATLDGGGPAVVVGDRAGHIYALHLTDGSEVAGWPASTGGIAVDSAPSSLGSTVFAGLGSPANPDQGGYARFSASGHEQLLTVALSPSGGPNVGVRTGLAVGTLQGQPAAVGGAMGQMQDAIAIGPWTPLPGFPWFEADSNFSTPALADLYSTGQNEIIEGGDSTAGLAFNYQYANGGHIRVLSGSGTLMCMDNTNEVVQASPAVGQFLGGGAVGIVVGTGTFYAGASDENKLIADNSHCGRTWEAGLDGATESSPALVDALGNGQLQVAQGTDNGSGGSVYLLNGANGQTIWRVPALGRVIGGIASVDLGSGYQDLVAGTTAGVEILDGRSGTVLWEARGLALQNTPLVTQDPDGSIGITVAGYTSSNSGEVIHYHVPGSNGGVVNEPDAWPMFHHDAQLTGDAGTPPPVHCHAPASPEGYWLGASDGGIFSFGNMPFCGSTGDVTLAKPVVGMAGTRDGGGYWLVASDGGIFTFGDAHFYGSAGNVRLRQPIVGMAATPDGGGYWLVASDGGIFAFGDAHFYGSTGAVHLRQPIVGMAATPDGGGYSLVASDGGIFTFGDAHFYGSTGNIHLRQPIVGMAATRDGGGYWLVASDGGIFTFGDAHFYGSTGAVHLRRPVITMAPTQSGNGYWLVASDGGIFTFGDAPFDGSTGGITLDKPIVAMAAY